MHTHKEELQIALDSVRSMEEMAHEGIMMVCKGLWQLSTPRLQRKYPQYAMPEFLYLPEQARYREFAGEQNMPVEEVLYLVDELIPIVRLLNENGWVNDRRGAGRLLRRMSYAHCLLGYEAAIGDVELYARFLGGDCRIGQEVYSPRAAWEAYQEGEPKQMIALLNCLFGESLRRLRKLTKSAALLPKVFWYEPKEDVVSFDWEVINTRYHLITSLLRFLEPVGNA